MLDRDWNYLVESYRPRIFKAVRKILKDRSQWEDVTQEVLLRVHQSATFLDLDGYQREKFVRTTAKNQALNFRRHQNQMRRDERRNVSVDVGMQHVEGGPGPSTVSDQLQMSSDVTAAIARLPKKHQVLIQLHYFKGQTYREMAETLGESEDAIFQQVKRILARLKIDLSLRKWINQLDQPEGDAR